MSRSRVRIPFPALHLLTSADARGTCCRRVRVCRAQRLLSSSVAHLDRWNADDHPTVFRRRAHGRTGTRSRRRTGRAAPCERIVKLRQLGRNRRETRRGTGGRSGHGSSNDRCGSRSGWLPGASAEAKATLCTLPTRHKPPDHAVEGRRAGNEDEDAPRSEWADVEVVALIATKRFVEGPSAANASRRTTMAILLRRTRAPRERDRCDGSSPRDRHHRPAPLNGDSAGPG